MTTQPNIRWQLLLAIVCLGLVFSLLSIQVQTAGLCSTRVPAAGGSLVEGIVGAPRYLNPLLSDGNLVDQEIGSLLFDGLVRFDEAGAPVPALAEKWRVSEDGRTVAFTLSDDAVWHDGEPVTAADVLFTYRLLQDEAFPAPAELRRLWQTVTISSTSPLSVTFRLAEAYSPFLEATARGILPEHLLGDVAPAEIPDDEFNLHPVGTGPFMVPQGENWRQTGRLHLAPNPAYWQQGIKLDNIEFRFYPNLDTLLEAYAAGEIQAINSVSPKVLPRVATLPGVRLYTAPQPRYTQLLFNLTEGGNPALREREVRQALAYALDREALIDGALHGQGIALQGPYLPSSWAYNPAALTLYPHRPISATTLLEEKGWALAEGAALRRQDGEDLTLRLLFLEQPLQRSVAETIASQWADAGVGVELVPVDEEVMTASLVGREFDVALTEVAPARDPDLYDFWSQEAIVKGQNYAGWSNRRASEALEQARQLWERAERQPYYDAFLRYFSAAVPALTLYRHVYTYALSEAVNDVEIGRIDYPRERYESLADWFLLYRDVTVNCPDES